MADVIIVTPQPIIVTQTVTTQTQELRTAIDVSAWDRLDLQVALLAVAGGTGTITVRMLTSMQNQFEDTSWSSTNGVVAGSQTFLHTELNFWKSLIAGNTSAMFRYVRWQVSLGSTTGATLMISGMGRRFA